MNVAAPSVSILLAALLAFSAIRKLALTLLAGAAGLCFGLLWEPIGVATALALVVYFLVAIAFHIRADDAEHLPAPLLLELLAAAALVLALA